MPFIKLQFRPGINRDTTNYTNEGGWFNCDKIRFRSGFPEKIGGWIKASSSTYLGVARQLLNWITSYSDNFLAIGTHQKVFIEVAGNFYDITPLRITKSSPDTDNCVATTNASNEITLGIVSHGANVGDRIIISGVTGSNDEVGGIPVSEINGEHEVKEIPDAN